MNEDKVVDQNDLDLLKVITRNNLKTKWKIIHDHQEKTNENWTNIEEKYTMDAIFVGSYFENFIALKLGDLNGDIFDRKPDVMSIDTEREPEWRKSKLTCDFQPNPFQISTQGKIFSDKIQTSVIEVFDMQGRSVLTMEKQFVTGLNTINIDRSDLPSSGIYVCKIHLGGEILTQRIVSMD